MPSTMWLLNIVTVVLQYSLVLLIYYFLYRAIRIAYVGLQPAVAGESVPERRRVKQERARMIVLDQGAVALAQHYFELNETTSIGRNDENDIVIAETVVSYEHACISKYKEGYWLDDLHSTNGTFLNGQRITQEAFLHNGDLIRIGSVTFKFEG
ncbi:Hypothetical protein LUCI_3205 [Lucifera butyrica]|uniref:FHA domain-containing protein n=1 Tax=Lucifera butyrica TaxID=1351585 RepID=A0A498RAG2_9FIRM|nr:FHA domain-containing protein [Lucifera butyrica]VBB07940.1 Hypothetical protein LUCI_3205 [Lucifera butyrica]